MSHAAQPVVTRASAHAPRAGSSLLWARGSVTRWATAVLALATVALLLYLGALVVVGWLAVAALAVLRPSSAPVVDVSGMLVDAAPALLVGWCVGRASAAVLEPGTSMPPAAAGVVAGLLGAGAGAVVLSLTGLL
jgi:hypothetical protein